MRLCGFPTWEFGLDQDLPKHEKIRFRRAEISDLAAMPSAGNAPPLGRAVRRRRFRWLKRGALAFVVLVLLAAGAIYAIGASGIGAARLQQEAQDALRRSTGTDIEVAGGGVGITLDGSSFLALQIRDVSLASAGGKPMMEAGAVRFGMRALPLVTGDVQLTSARISNARIDLAALPAGGDWSEALRNGQGLVDPDKVIAAIFGTVREALGAVKPDSLRTIRLVDVELLLPSAGEVRSVRIADAAVRQAGADRVEISLTATVDGRMVNLAGVAARDPHSLLITDLDATLELSEPQTERRQAAAGHAPGIGTLHLTGREGGDGTPSRLQLSLDLKGTRLDLGKRGMLVSDIGLQARLESGSNKLDIARLLVETGRSSFVFQGSVGPQPIAGSTPGPPAYRYDFVSDGSTVAPGDSSEPALRFLSRVAGTYDAASRKLFADTIAVRSGAGGEAVGMARLEFAEGLAPGLFLALDVHDMPVSHAKQLWPWLAAGSARRWVLKNLFGGKIPYASVHYDVAPGRLADDIPLNENEVSGAFEIEGSRFDTAGHIPPVRDAVGRIEFAGKQVRILLDSGTVYMPSGRIAAASNGKLLVDDATVAPVIGKLNIDVEGNADAIVELASYKPINAMRYVGMKPEEFSGKVSGNVRADIPLHSDADTGELDWRVALDYKHLGLAREFDGQRVSEADGSIVVDPQKAVIAATASLNGIPAEVDLVEPLQSPGVERIRKVALVLDDKLREKFMPGLSRLLAGTIKVSLENTADGARTVSTDLTAARLTLPWVGWSKGAGIAAKAAFLMRIDGDTTRLSDFTLDGKSFSARGDAVLLNGALSSATFSRVRLNREDDVTLSVRRSGAGYKVDLSGAALDARALIKQFSADAGASGKARDGVDAISLTAAIDTLTGFHGEVLKDVRLSYDAVGSRMGGLKLDATTGGGAMVSAQGGGSGGQRSLSMRSADAGAILRFLDIYEHVQGGGISIAMQGSANGPLRGQVNARDFFVVEEPKLASIVSTTPQGDNRSLNQAVHGKIDTSRVKFERGFTEVEKGADYMKLANGVLRGPMIGTTFQGILYDRDDNMDMTGTFMPAYGLNRIFGELPLIGMLLGNGRDRGLIGVTYRLRGNMNKPQLDINPLSIIAPGIFRSIFEYR